MNFARGLILFLTKTKHQKALKLHTLNRKTGHNTGFASGGVTCKLGGLSCPEIGLHINN